MTEKRRLISQKPSQLPARFQAGFAWDLDRRSATAREVSADLEELWVALGGVENLSPQRAWLCERVVFLRRRMLAYETATMAGTEPPMTAGEYSNHANVMQGYLKALGLDRIAKTMPNLRSYLEGRAEPVRSSHEAS
jgi:hypothetical protein